MSGVRAGRSRDREAGTDQRQGNHQHSIVTSLAVCGATVAEDKENINALRQ
jgi:hypothetical protein